MVLWQSPLGPSPIPLATPAAPELRPHLPPVWNLPCVFRIGLSSFSLVPPTLGLSSVPQNFWPTAPCFPVLLGTAFYLSLFTFSALLSYEWQIKKVYIYVVWYAFFPPKVYNAMTHYLCTLWNDYYRLSTHSPPQILSTVCLFCGENTQDLHS